MNNKLSIVIINYNSGEDLRKVIPTVINEAPETIIVDNSTDYHSFEIACSFPDTIVIRVGKNLGYAEGANLGIKLSKGEFVAILNPDTYFTKGYFKKLIEKMEKEESLGTATGKILRFDKKTLDTTGQFRTLADRPKERGYGKKSTVGYKSGNVFSACGAAVLYRRKALESIKDKHGYFDSRYFVFFEDFDLGWRLRKKGWKAWFREDAIGYHRRGGIKRGAKFPFLKLSPQMKAIVVRNYWLTIAKNESIIGFILKLPFILARSVLLLAVLSLTPSSLKFLYHKIREVI